MVTTANLATVQIGGSGATPHIRHQSRTVSGFSPAHMAVIAGLDSAGA
jgi:hypothetical protein